MWASVELQFLSNFTSIACNSMWARLLLKTCAAIQQLQLVVTRKFFQAVDWSDFLVLIFFFCRNNNALAKWPIAKGQSCCFHLLRWQTTSNKITALNFERQQPMVQHIGETRIIIIAKNKSSRQPSMAQKMKMKARGLPSVQSVCFRWEECTSAYTWNYIQNERAHQIVFNPTTHVIVLVFRGKNRVAKHQTINIQ